MQINILVTGGIHASQSAYTALQFCRAATAAKHVISQAFFYQDGVSNANQLSVPLSDEFDAVNEWVAFADENDVELVVCVSAGERRGIIGGEQAKEFNMPAANLHPRYLVAGLGVLHTAMLGTDRMVSFK